MIETWSLLFILAEEPKNKVFLIQDDPQGEVADVIEECHEEIETTYNNVKDLRSTMSGLEFYMKDKILKEENCPKIEWEQPDIEIYKAEPKSYLPEECQKVLDELEQTD